MSKHNVQFMIECCIPTQSDGIGSIEMKKEGALDFVPFRGLVMCVDERDSPLTVDQVFFNMDGKGSFTVWFEAEENEDHGKRALIDAGWTEV